MITTKEIKIKLQTVFTSENIEKELNNMGLDYLRWAITGIDDKFYTIDVAIVN